MIIGDQLEILKAVLFLFASIIHFLKINNEKKLFILDIIFY
jgi:hypothetical protein